MVASRLVLGSGRGARTTRSRRSRRRSRDSRPRPARRWSCATAAGCARPPPARRCSQHADAIFAQVAGGRGRPRRGPRHPRRTTADRLVPVGRGDADAAQAVAPSGDRHPERDAVARRGRARGDRAAPARRRVRPRAAVRVSRAMPERPGAASRRPPLLHDPMCVALPVEHQLARKPTSTLRDLRDEDWVQTSARAPAPGTSSASAWRPASSRASRSSPTTTRPCRDSSPPASASR